MDIKVTCTLNGYDCPFVRRQEYYPDDATGWTDLTCNIHDNSVCPGLTPDCPLVHAGTITVSLRTRKHG